MNFEYIETSLDKKDLSIISLRVLIPDDQLYKVACFQPKGAVEARADSIRNSDQLLAVKKHREFLSIALNENVELALSPEYSCPWATIEQIIQQGMFPANGNLWVLGCESISPNELAEVCNRNNDVVWIYEELPSNDRRFLDPICYFLNASQNGSQNIKNVVVLQFKQQRMADGKLDFIERDNMILGSKAYILRNDANSIYLATLICADGLTFEDNQLLQHSHPHIIIHPQLNYNPRHITIRRYRNEAYLYNKVRDYICINWSRGAIVSQVGSPTAFGGSGFYTKSDEIDLEDARINENHYKGLYYARCAENYSHVYLLNYDEFVFLFRTTKLSQHGVPAVLQGTRTGPQALKAYTWNEAATAWAEGTDVDDGFHEICHEAGLNLGQLEASTTNPLDRERLLALSTGQIDDSQGIPWYSPLAIKFFRINQDEIVRRLTFFQDPDEDAKAARIHILHCYWYLLNSILQDETKIPACISDLFNNHQVKYPWKDGHFQFNICREDQAGPAAVVYLGPSTFAIANKVADRMAGILKEDSKRLVIWYQHGDEIKWISPPMPQIDDEVEDRRNIDSGV